MKPLPLSPESLQAWRDNRKGQTRRVILPQPPVGFPNLLEVSPGKWNWLGPDDGESLLRPPAAHDQSILCPFGRKGEALWVREALVKSEDDHALYRFDKEPVVCGRTTQSYLDWRWKPNVLPARYMPKEACRYVLWSKGIQAQRLKDLSFDDCLAEGIISTPFWGKDVDFEAMEADPRRLLYEGEDEDGINQGWTDYVRGVYFLWWDAINQGRGHGSDTDPWVWVVGIPSFAEWKFAVDRGWRRRAA